MNTKKYVVAIGVVAAVLTGATSLVLAENNMMGQDTSSLMMPTTSMVDTFRPQPMVLQVGPEGKVLLRGIVSAVGASSLTVKSWGGDWIVNVHSSARVLPENATLSQFAVGDFVGAQGMVNQSALWTIDATLVRDWTAKKTGQGNTEILKRTEEVKREDVKNLRELKDNGSQGVQSQIQSILEQIKKIQAQINAEQGQ